MKKDIAEKWVAALRSGEFRQGQSTLEKDGAFCCLGVLAQINGLMKNGRCGSLVGKDIGRDMLTSDALELFGMATHEQLKCTIWNDKQRLTFSQIADRIEAEL